MLSLLQVKSLFRVLRLGVTGVVIVTALAISISAQPPGEHKKVLILFNNDSYTATQIAIDRGLRSTLKNGSTVPVETYSEYVGDTRAGTGYEAEFVALLRRKYQGKKFDAIFCIGQFPLTTVLRNRAELFPNTPIVFLAIDARIVAGLVPAPGVTGVSGKIEFKPNLDLALALHPGTKRVVVIQGVSETDKRWADRAKEDFREYGSRLEITELVGLTVTEMRTALASLPPDTIVFFVSSIQDRDGNTFESPEYLQQVASASTAPIYGTTEGQLGRGIVGGNLLSFEELGSEGGRLGLRLLAGENPSDLPPVNIPGRLIFDSRELERWKISEASLPEGSVVQFKQPSVWEEYKWYAIGLLGAVIVQSLLISWLIFARIRRRQAESEKVRLSNRLNEIVSNVPGTVWETRTDPATNLQITTFISNYVEKMTGYSAREWLEQPPEFGLRLTLEEDQDSARRETEAVIASGKESVSEFRARTKDGRVQWIENHLSPIFDGDQNVIGMRGVALDVTNRKVAEQRARETEQKDRAILAAIPDLIFLQSEDGVYLDYHAKEPSELFAPPDAFLGKNMRDVLPPHLAKQFFELFARAEDGGDPEILEYGMDREGDHRWYEARMVRIGDKILTVVRDITVGKRAELEAQELSGRLITAQEDERARLARELHDDACQNLAVLAIELEMFGQKFGTDNGHANDGWKKLSSHAANIAGDLRRMSHELHPAKLEQLGLSSAIRGFCREIEAAHGVKVDFVERNVPRTLPDATSLSLYRIVQESLQNVVKHSGATAVTVVLTSDRDTLVLTVSDNGRGFDLKAVPAGTLGLVSMKERIRLLNGTITIDSTENEGTQIEATVPLR